MLVKKVVGLVVAGAMFGSTLIGSTTVLAAENTPTVEELWKLVQQQQEALDALKEQLLQAQNQMVQTQERASDNSEKIELVGDQLDSAGNGGSSWAERTTIGAYGEVLYNNETSGSSTRELDVQRYVMFMSHKFSDSLRFFSELEIEHGDISDDARSPGAVELEQAYLEWGYSDKHSVLAGMHLVPMGIMNETHEPNTFYGVERNRIESRIIPSTYRVNGVKFAGQLGSGWSYDLGIHEGLFFESGNGGELNIRDARQSGARAEMDSLAYTGRIRYTGIAGLELGVAMQIQTDMTQNGSTRGNIGRDGVVDIFGNPVDDLNGVLSEAHISWQKGAFGLRALYAQWDIDDRIERVANNDGSVNGIGRDEQYGFYLEPSYRFNSKFGAFARYERTDERAGSNQGAAADSETERVLVGFNYWLNDNAVFKLDYQFENDEKDRDLNGFNLGIGWQF